MEYEGSVLLSVQTRGWAAQQGFGEGAANLFFAKTGHKIQLDRDFPCIASCKQTHLQ